MRIGVATYGMDLWDGGLLDIEERLAGIRSAGYVGTEAMVAVSPGDALQKAALYRKMGMDFGACQGPNLQATIEWTSGLGKQYVWLAASGPDFKTFCRQANRHAELCARWGLRPALHNHLDTPVETQEQIESFLKNCAGCGLVLDTAHLALAGGDSVEIIRKHAGRICALHIKDWLTTHPEIGRDMWIDRGRFCELGAGNIGLDNMAVMRALADARYDGWVFVEQDTHLRNPLEDLAVSRRYLREAGF